MRIIIIFILFVLTIGCSNNKVVKNHGLNALDINDISTGIKIADDPILSDIEVLS